MKVCGGWTRLSCQSDVPARQPHLMELLIMIDALIEGVGRKDHGLMPYYGYRETSPQGIPRTSISARLVANLVTVAGGIEDTRDGPARRPIQGFFDIS